MKIDYNILWIDDEIEAFQDDGFLEQIEQHLINLGFKSNVIPVSKSETFFQELNRFENTLDLILTDYNMSGMNGAEVVKEVREKSVSTEILFYTAQTDWTDIGKIDRVSFLQTNSIPGGTHHEKVADKAIKLIDLTVKKFQHIVAMRGMIMHETSSLDSQSMEILRIYLGCEAKGCNKCNQKAKCTPISDAIFEKLEEHLSGKMDDICEYKRKGNFKALMKDNFLFSADYKVQALSGILKELKLDDFSGDYKKEIIGVRNKFAHAVLQKDSQTGRDYFSHGSEGITFDENYCKKIRQDIYKHKENFDKLESKIGTIHNFV